MDIDMAPAGVGSPAKSSLALTLRRKAATIGLLLVLLWSIWLIDDFLFAGRLGQLGVVPRTVRGLWGIVCGPFLHASWSHISSNSVGLLMLGGLLILRNEKAFWATSMLGGLCAGAGTWLIGRGNSSHIGFSGVLFAYFGYLLFAGVFERRIGSILLSVLVFVVWGGMLWSAAPWVAGGAISWEEHLCGLLGGIATAKMLARPKNGTQNPNGR